MIKSVVIGRTHATTKHESMEGQRFLVVRKLDIQDQPIDDPLVVVDAIGARKGDQVLISSDGKFAKDFVDSANTPVRWTTVAIVD